MTPPVSATRIYVAMLAFCAATSIPMSFFFFILPATLRQAGHPAEVVSLAALVYLPYALRFLWAPLVDRAGRGVAGRYRAVALAMLAAAVVALAAFLPIDPKRDAAAVLSVAGLVFVFLATGMSALDGYVVSTLGDDGRKRVAIVQAAGFTLGAVLVGFGAIAIDGASWTLTVALLAVATAMLGVTVSILPRLGSAPAGLARSPIIGELTRFLRSPQVRRRAALSLLAKGGLGLPIGYLAVLQVDSGLSAAEVGLFGAVGSNIGGLVAAFAVGGLLVRWGGWQTLAALCAAASSILAVAALCHADLAGPAFAVTLSLAVLSLSYGYTVLYRALVLTICGGDLGATQAALLSCFDVVIGILAAALSGVVVTITGLGGLLGLAALGCLGGTVLAVRAFSLPDEVSPTPLPQVAT